MDSKCKFKDLFIYVWCYLITTYESMTINFRTFFLIIYLFIFCHSPKISIKLYCLVGYGDKVDFVLENRAYHKANFISNNWILAKGRVIYLQLAPLQILTLRKLYASCIKLQLVFHLSKSFLYHSPLLRNLN